MWALGGPIPTAEEARQKKKKWRRKKEGRKTEIETSGKWMHEETQQTVANTYTHTHIGRWRDERRSTDTYREMERERQEEKLW